MKLVGKFPYLSSSVLFTESDVNIRLAKAWTVIDRLSVISDLPNNIKQEFFQAVAVLLYGCTTWTLTKCIEKKSDGNYT